MIHIFRSLNEFAIERSLSDPQNQRVVIGSFWDETDRKIQDLKFLSLFSKILRSEYQTTFFLIAGELLFGASFKLGIPPHPLTKYKVILGDLSK